MANSSPPALQQSFSQWIKVRGTNRSDRMPGSPERFKLKFPQIFDQKSYTFKPHGVVVVGFFFFFETPSDSTKHFGTVLEL